MRSIFSKGLLILAIPLFFQLAFIWAVAHVKEETRAAQMAQKRANEVVLGAKATLRQLLEAQTGIRGYLITGNPDFLEPLHQAREQLPRLFKQLEATVSDELELLASIRLLQIQTDKYLDFSTNVEALVKRGDRDAAAARIGSAHGENLVGEVREELDRIVRTKQALDAQQETLIVELWNQLDRVLVLGTIAAVLATAVAIWLFSRGIVARLAVVTGNARRLANRQILAPPVHGGDEISHLDRVFHSVADQLSQAALQESAYKQLLERRAEELAEANRELAHQNQENEMFVYSVSHDLRSPLVNLQGFSQELGLVCEDLRLLLAESDLPEKVRDRGVAMVDRDVKESIRFIQTAVTRLSNIIDSLLRLSRVGRVEYRWQEVDVQATVTRILEALKGTIAEKGAEVSVKELPPAWGDATAIEQIFANLISNALNYLSPDRQGFIEVGVVDPADRPDAGEMHTYYVRDNGLGIAEAYLPKIFVAFQRLHADVAQGEGIGLALVRRMVERHNGKIWVESREGAGSTFFVSLPARSPESDGRKHSGSGTVLVQTGAGQ